MSSVRARRRCADRAPRLEPRSRGAVASRPRLQRTASTPRTTAPASAATGGITHARRLKPRFGGEASTCSPKSATSLRLISDFVSPAAIRARMKFRMRLATGDDDWSSVVWHVGQTTSLSISASVGCDSLAAAGPAKARMKHKAGAESCRLMSRAPPGCPPRSPPCSARPETRTRAGRRAERRTSPETREPVVVEQPPGAVVDDRIREVVPASEAAGVRFEVVCVEADHHHALRPPLLPRRLQTAAPPACRAGTTRPRS